MFPSASTSDTGAGASHGLASPSGDLDGIDAGLLGSLVARATALLGADGAGVRFLLDETTSVGTALPTSLGVVEELQMNAAAGPGHLARVTGQPVAADGRDDRPGTRCMRALADLTGVRAVLSVPLLEGSGTHGGGFGVLSAYSMSPRRWSATDIEVLEALAQLAASFLLFSKAVHQQSARIEGLRHAVDGPAIRSGQQRVRTSGVR